MKCRRTWFCSWSWMGWCLAALLHWRGWEPAGLPSCPTGPRCCSCGLLSFPSHVPGGWPSPFSPSSRLAPTAAQAPPRTGCGCVGVWHTSVAGCHWYQWRGHSVPRRPGSLALRSGNAGEGRPCLLKEGAKSSHELLVCLRLNNVFLLKQLVPVKQLLFVKIIIITIIITKKKKKIIHTNICHIFKTTLDHLMHFQKCNNFNFVKVS